MEEDAETRKISSSFLRDHSYATEGEPGPQPPARPQQVRPPRSGPGPRPPRRAPLRALPAAVPAPAPAPAAAAPPRPGPLGPTAAAPGARCGRGGAAAVTQQRRCRSRWAPGAGPVPRRSGGAEPGTESRRSSARDAAAPGPRAPPGAPGPGERRVPAPPSPSPAERSPRGRGDAELAGAGGMRAAAAARDRLPQPLRAFAVLQVAEAAVGCGNTANAGADLVSGAVVSGLFSVQAASGRCSEVPLDWCVADARRCQGCCTWIMSQPW